MKLLIEKFESKEPHYPNIYLDLIESLSRKKDVSRSDGSDEEQFERGKAFGTFYECYMYATIIGIKANNYLPFERANGKKFLKVGAWRHKQITKYLFMSLLALSDISFEKIEDLNDEEANNKANELIHLMEGYAKGGFEIIQKQMNDDQFYFGNPINLVSFLNQSKNVL